jgi:hypothetical protein
MRFDGLRFRDSEFVAVRWVDAGEHCAAFALSASKPLASPEQRRSHTR